MVNKSLQMFYSTDNFMKKYFKIIALLLVVGIFFYCNNKPDNGETILTGKTKILVDETLLPIIEDQVQVFESDYKAKITLVPKSEAEVMQALFNDSIQIAVLSHKLSVEDSLRFIKKKKHPRQTPFATDAIALISNKNNNDTLIALLDVVNFMKGIASNKIKGLVFDNPNSSTMRYFNELAGLKTNPEKGIFSFKTNEEVIKYVSENSGMIGVVGVNWLLQPTANVEKFKQNINILNVKGLTGNDYFYPSQNNLAEKTYPLARDLYSINCQPIAGLGMGFSSFISGERGQRLILKSGLLPIRVPSRNIQTRKEIIKSNQ
jgi:phosphate transport system substrate-binding protein